MILCALRSWFWSRYTTRRPFLCFINLKFLRKKFCCPFNKNFRGSMLSLPKAIFIWQTSIQTPLCQTMIVVNLDIPLPPVPTHVHCPNLSLPKKSLVAGSICLKRHPLDGNKSQHSASFSAEVEAERLPSLSSHDLLAIWHAHAVRMCVSVKVLLLLEVATKALALGYRTIFVL